MVQPGPEKLKKQGYGERRFLDRLLDEGDIEPEHLTDEDTLRHRISRQPMLLWRQQHVREHKEKSRSGSRGAPGGSRT